MTTQHIQNGQIHGYMAAALIIIFSGLYTMQFLILSFYFFYYFFLHLQLNGFMLLWQSIAVLQTVLPNSLSFYKSIGIYRILLGEVNKIFLLHWHPSAGRMYQATIKQFVLKVNVLEAAQTGKHKDLSGFTRVQIVITGQLGQSISKQRDKL